jgi:hypothetical protein
MSDSDSPSSRLAAHGSLKRDIDIISVPWTEEAIGAMDLAIDAGPEQGLRLAAIRQLEAESPQRLVAKIIALPIELLWVNGVQRKFIDSERLRALILPVPAAGSPAPSAPGKPCNCGPHECIHPSRLRDGFQCEVERAAEARALEQRDVALRALPDQLRKQMVGRSAEVQYLLQFFIDVLDKEILPLAPPREAK